MFHHIIEEKFYKHSGYMAIYLEVEDGRAVSAVSRKLKENQCIIDTFDVDKPKVKGQNFQIMTTFQISKNINKEECLRMLQELKGVISLSEI